MMTLSQNHCDISERIQKSALRSGRNSDAITLVAVSKNQEKSKVFSALDLGIRVFAESRVQEMKQKFEPRPKMDIEVHMIGHLQSNKVGVSVRLADWIQSVDSKKLLLLIDNHAEKEGRVTNLCIEVNTSAEDSKFGLRQDAEVCHLAAIARELPHVNLRGLMTIGPLLQNGEPPLRKAFVRLRTLFNYIDAELAPPHWDCLSMGMSNDFEIAIEEGATMVRIGTGLFGQRS